ncbi:MULTISPECIES: dihydrofolate reductase family protein [Microbacterium]|uniref:dihydrofolate reductase family protein n=1 Tax=Microbacterium TaxID=33882 RepID=UPI00217D8253|nr:MULTISPECIES: dihydrofolate reductase family protein [Microbacterium]UWF78500.1 dihydrofolate reductase family protein [Microbacterium neungamense]WCM56677.1 dihydrofolate reductase family protein [Microbacterium sp. EF45047]
MGSIIVEQIVSADGYAVDELGGIDFFWEADFGDESDPASEQMHRLARVDAVLFGRRTYEMFAAYWPERTAEEEAVATYVNGLPKYVLSSTLERAPWGEGEIAVLSGTATDAAELLRSRHGDVIVWGSLDLTDALFWAGQVDVLRLRILPVVLGAGRSFAPAGMPHLRLELDHTEAGPTGIVTIEYRAAGDRTGGAASLS